MHVAMHREKHWNKGRRYFNRRVMDERPCVAVSLVNTPFFCTKTWKPEKKKQRVSAWKWKSVSRLLFFGRFRAKLGPSC